MTSWRMGAGEGLALRRARWSTSPVPRDEPLDGYEDARHCDIIFDVDTGREMDFLESVDRRDAALRPPHRQLIGSSSTTG
jgi:hypothetical protein